MPSPEPNDVSQESFWPLSGTSYSRLLVYRYRKDLYDTLGRLPTNEEVANAMGVATADVVTVSTSVKTFGNGLFQRLAEEKDQTLIAYMADLARWSRENLG